MTRNDEHEDTHRRRLPNILRQEVDIDELMIAIRSVLCVQYESSRQDESAVMVGRGLLPPVVEQVDVGAFLAWIRLGARILGGRDFPSLKMLRDEVTRMVLALTLRRAGSISKASRILVSSRKVLRDNMVRTGLYPWPPADGRPQG